MERWRGHPLAARLVAAAEKGTALAVAVPEAIRAFWLAALPGLLGRPVVTVVAGAAEAERLAHDIAAFDDEPEVFEAWETLPYEHVSPSVETMGNRVRLLRRFGSDAPPSLTLLPIRALLQRLAPASVEDAALTLTRGARVDLEAVERHLVSIGYERTYMVESRGEFAVRGGILDVFPSTDVQPLRIELWGDEIDTIRRFSVGDQRSVVEVAGATIHPCREFRPGTAVRARAARLAGVVPGGREALTRISDGELFAGMESWVPWLVDDTLDPEGAGQITGGDTVLDHLPVNALVLVLDPKRCLDRATDLRREEEDLADALAGTWELPHAGLLEAITDEHTESGEDGAVAAVTGTGDGTEAGEVPGPRELPHLFLDAAHALEGSHHPVWLVPPAPEGPDMPAIACGSIEPALGRADALAAQLKELLARDQTVVVAADGIGSRSRIREHLVEEGLALRAVEGVLDVDPGRVGLIAVAPLSRGFVSADLGLAVVAEPDVTGRRRAHRRPSAARMRRDAEPAPPFGDLRPGDHVVHYHHGVGRFEGIVTRGIGGVDREYLEIHYAGHDRLYVPVDQVDAVRKYVGGETPRLSRMGGTDWARTKGKVRSAVAEIAEGLVSLYRERLATHGHAHGADGEWMQRLVETFPYEETPDQARAIAEVGADMEGSTPMDRLVCGDVGYGKTEIAVRAVLKTVADGRQAAVLVPTTVLAQQHHQTFSERFADLPIRVEMLSRFLTPAEQKRVVADLQAGRVDAVVGTHRLLTDDIEIPRLGLLVVDEEQRFGVKAKERVKELRTSVDVLTMTATPIPRTLEFALTGIRDMSVVNTPPEDRRPVLTYVGEFDEQAVAGAIRRELLRDGQVFYVHNRVQSIDRVTAQLRRLVPEARIAVAHGQMDEGSLERIMLGFWDGDFDVLVATTIIESGLDIPRANTLIVDRADLLGLAQLYQLRGRVGRARQRAYAYLFYPPDRVLTEEAHERLKVIAEHQDLGSGFAIAMRDLELRGAGNLLGPAQSGHIAAVGFDLYCELVNEAVAVLRGEAVEEVEPVRIDLPLETAIPVDYMPKESLRLEAYRRLGDATTEEAVADVRDEWEDRYGPLPEGVENLLESGRVRAAAVRSGVREIVFARDQVRLSPCVPVGSRRMRFERMHKGTVVKEDLRQTVVPYDDPRARSRGAGGKRAVSGRDVCNWIISLLEELT
ncbi:MAG: transcription-repair coupling factor [Acidimicrobiia bacterium]|nr:transcription-repair coupling factor [Acidimicrobiia bacterium]